MALKDPSQWVKRELAIATNRPQEVISHPRMTYSPGGDLFISSANHTIHVVRLRNPNRIHRFAGRPDTCGSADGNRRDARFNVPRGLLCDAVHGILVADRNSRKIRSIVGDQVTTFAGTGKDGYDDGPKSTCSFAAPIDIVRCRSFLLVLDRINIRFIDDDGMVTSMGSQGDTSWNDHKAFSNYGWLLVSPDGLKSYEMCQEGSIFKSFCHHVDSDVQTKISHKSSTSSLVLSNNDSIEDNNNYQPKSGMWPPVAYTSAGYIIPRHGTKTATLFSWNTDNQIQTIPMFDRKVYQMAISPVDGTLAYFSQSLNVDFYPVRLSFIQSYAHPWEPVQPPSSSILDFSSLFNNPFLSDIEFPPSRSSPPLTVIESQVESADVAVVVANSNIQATSAESTIKLHSEILSTYFSSDIPLHATLERLRDMNGISLEVKHDFLRSLYMPSILRLDVDSFTMSCANNISASNTYNSNLQLINHLCSVIYLYHLFDIESRSMRSDLWRLILRRTLARNGNGDITTESINTKFVNIAAGNTGETIEKFFISIFSHVWRECNQDWNLLDIVVSFMQSFPDIMFTSWNDLRALITFDPCDDAKMPQLMASFFHATINGPNLPRNDPPLKITSERFLDAERWKDLDMDPTMLMITKLARSLKHMCEGEDPHNIGKAAHHSDLRASTIEHTPLSLSGGGGDGCGMFRFDILGCDRPMFVHGWVLYCRWNFFRRMVDFGGTVEISSRNIILPIDFPYELLQCVIAILYYNPPRPLHLGKDTCSFFLDQGAQFNLLCADGAPLKPFDNLHHYCSTQIFEPLTVSNCIAMANLYAKIGREPMLDTAITFAAANYLEAFRAGADQLQHITPDVLYRITQLYSSMSSKSNKI